MQWKIRRQYAVQTTVAFQLYENDGTDILTSTPTPLAADIRISKDEGAFADATNTPVYEGDGWVSIVLTATEMTAARIMISVRDVAGGPNWFPTGGYIETTEHQSAQHDTDVFFFTVDDATFTPTTTQFEVNETLPTAWGSDDIPIGRPLYINGEVTFILALDVSEKRFTVRALSAAPSDPDPGRVR